MRGDRSPSAYSLIETFPAENRQAVPAQLTFVAKAADTDLILLVNTNILG